MKNLIYLFTILIIFSFRIQAQDVKFSKNKVLVDKAIVFDFNRKSAGQEFTLYKQNTDTEIIYMLYNRNGTEQYEDDDYKKIVFIENNVIVESSTLKFRTWKYIIKLLLEEKVMDLEGNIDVASLENFVTKYDEKITQ